MGCWEFRKHSEGTHIRWQQSKVFKDKKNQAQHNKFLAQVHDQRKQ